jgi:hypothetical protein
MVGHVDEAAEGFLQPGHVVVGHVCAAGQL